MMKWQAPLPPDVPTLLCVETMLRNNFIHYGMMRKSQTHDLAEYTVVVKTLSMEKIFDM